MSRADRLLGEISKAASGFSRETTSGLMNSISLNPGWTQSLRGLLGGGGSADREDWRKQVTGHAGGFILPRLELPPG